MERGYFQHQNELSKFDDSVIKERRERERQSATEAAYLRQQSGPAAKGLIPGQDGTFYDPDHHAADYAGLVSRDKLERSHFSGKQETHMEYGPLGVAPAESVSTSDYAGQGRKHFEKDARFQSAEVVPGSAPLFADPTYYVSGGQDDRWQSSAMAANAQVPTDPQLKAKGFEQGGRKHVTPAYEQGNRHLVEITNAGRRAGETTSQSGDAYAMEHPRSEPGQLLGYRATAFKAGAPSMLATLGKAVVGGGAESGFPDRPARPVRDGAAYAQSRQKGDYILDSTPGVIPGYTGRTRY